MEKMEIIQNNSTIYNSNKLTKLKYIEQFDLNNKYIKTWDSAYEAAKKMGFNCRQILLCCNNKAKSHKKFIWKFTSEPDKLNEYWKELKGELKGLFVSNLGRYHFKDTSKLYGFITTNGSFMVNYNKQNYDIAVLVLIAYKGNPYNDLYIPYHYDADKSNNNINNLCWVFIYSDIPNDLNYIAGFNVSVKPIQQFKNEKLIHTFDSIYDAGKQLNISPKLILKCAEGINNYAGGFQWKYDDDPDLIDENWTKHPNIDILVSSVGRIKSPTMTKKSYGVLNNNMLFKHGDYYVHVLIAETFINNTDNYNFVEHINNNTQNNCVYNLKWVYCDDNLL